MKIFQEEVFGPILTMIKATDADEAVAYIKCNRIWSWKLYIWQELPSM